MNTAELKGQLAAARALRVTERVKTSIAMDEIDTQLDRLCQFMASVNLTESTVSDMNRAVAHIQDTVGTLRGFLSTTRGN